MFVDFLFFDILITNKSFIISVGYAVAQLVAALRYKPEGRGFDSTSLLLAVEQVGCGSGGLLPSVKGRY